MDKVIASKKEIFETIRQELTCHNCQEIPEAEIYISSIGERTTCVACTSNLPEIRPYVRSLLAEKMLISLQIPCEFTKCEKRLDPGTMEDHKKECKFRTIDCIMQLCSSRIVIYYRGLTEHLAKTHDFHIFARTITPKYGSNVIDVIFPAKEENFNQPRAAWNMGPYLLRGKKFIAFMIYHKEKQIVHVYLQLYGSRREAHGLRYKIEIGDEVQQGLTSSAIAQVLSLDDKKKYINDNLEGLVIPFAVMKKYIIQDELRLKIEIKDDNPKIKTEQQLEQPEQQRPDEDSAEPETKKIKTPDDDKVDEEDDDDIQEVEKDA